MNKIQVVEFPKPKPAITPTLLELHPLPWVVGEEHETMAEILDANRNRVTRLEGGRILTGAYPGDLARKLVNLVNAFGELLK